MRYRHLTCLLIILLPATLAAHPGASTTIEHFTHQIEHRPDQQAPIPLTANTIWLSRIFGGRSHSAIRFW